MLYLQKYLTNFQKLFFAERQGRWVFWLKISIAQIFWFCNSNFTIFQHPENVKISIFPFTLSQRKFYIFNSIYRIFKNFFLAERRGRWLLLLKISCALRFWFGNSNVTTFQNPENVKISIFPFTLSREKCYIFKSILRIFKNIFLAERWGR